jgi:transcriptional regulator with XRE-family HTH domain
MNGLGQALRWLRDRIGKKQYQVAAAAGVTKGMLSAYETGRQKPSLDTLEKLLNTLGCDLHDLHNALEIVNGKPGIVRQAEVSTAKMGAVWDRGFPDLYSVLGQSQPLPPELENALGQLLDGFHKLIRYMHWSLAAASGAQAATEKPE